MELEEGSKRLIEDLKEILAEAEAGEFGEFTNEKYPNPKMVLADKLSNLRVKIFEGEYD